MTGFVPENADKESEGEPLRLALLHILLFLGPSIWAAQVTRIGPSELLVGVTHDPNLTWRLNDQACLEPPKDWDPDDKYEPVCGWVVVTTLRGAVVKFDEAPDDLEEGRELKLGEAPPPNARMLSEAARRETELKHWEEMIPFYSLLTHGSAAMLGEASSESVSMAPRGRTYALGLGFNFFRPKGMTVGNVAPGMGMSILPSLIYFQTALQEDATMGVGAFYSSYNDEGIPGTYLGAQVTYNWYPTRLYHGWWFQFAGGFSTTTNTFPGQNLKYNAYHGLATLGWRGGGALNWGVAAGGQVVYAPTFIGQAGGFLLFIPTAQLDIAWNF